MTLVPPFLLLDRYDVTEEIGHGGHAIVYRAHDRVLDREVAVKLLRDESLSTDMIARFRQEVQVTAQLEHAHILHVYDTGEHAGRPYIVMELASGRTLAERLAREGPLPVADALQIARDVGLALAHAHARGVVHRDVKPENILLGEGGAILADFGIARVTQDILTRIITTTGTTVGTVQYMSPEQLCAEPNIDARTDQYSLACVLYEMLAGVRPHIAATFEGLRLLRMTGQHAPVSSHRRSVPDYVDDAIATALSPMPADRFRSMEEFLAAIGVEASGELGVGRSSDAMRVSGGHGGVARSSSRPSVADRGASRSNQLLGRWWTRSRTISAASVGTIAIAGLASVLLKGSGASTAPSDGSTVFALAANSANADTSLLRLRSALRSELSAWTGVRVVDAVPRGDTTTYAVDPEVVRVGDSLRVSVSLRRNTKGAVAPKLLATVIAARDLDIPEPFVASLAPLLLMRAVAPGLTEAEVPGVAAVPGRAMQALEKYVQGFVQLRAGQLDSAANRFREASTAAAGFAYAQLWAAQSGAWVDPRRPESWRADVEGVLREGKLVGNDSLHALALGAIARADFSGACNAFRTLTEREPKVFAWWFGLGDCQRADPVVLHTGEGLRFRSSHWSALSAYRAAVERAPTSELLSALFPRILSTTYAESGRVRSGRDETGNRFSAMPALDADSIALIPVAQVKFGNLPPPSTWLQAGRRGRLIAMEITRRWTERWPESSSAWLQYALALEMAGRYGPNTAPPSAEKALARARSGRTTDRERAHISVATVRVALRRGDMLAAWEAARSAIADSVGADPVVRVTLAPLAVLIGDFTRAQRLAVPDTERAAQIPADVADSVTSFRLRAVMEACKDMEKNQAALESMFSARFGKDEVPIRRKEVLHQAYRDAVPCLGPRPVSAFAPEMARDSVYQAIENRNYEAARRQLRAIQARRRGATVSTITWDYIYAEAWAAVAAGDTAEAATRLRGALTDIASMSSYTLSQTAQAAGLRQGIVLARQIAKPSENDWWNAGSVALDQTQSRKE